MARRDRNGWAYGGDDSFRIQSIIAKIFILILISYVLVTECSNNGTEDITRLNSEIPEKLKILEAFTGRGFFSDVYQNGTFRTGNSLWDNLLNKCSLKPSVSCLQKNFYSYLDDSLDLNGDISVASGVNFKKNNVDMNKYSKEANVIYLTGSKDKDKYERSFEEENEINDDEESETPFEEVTDALYKKGVKFLMTHDMKVTLPEMLFDGATLKVSPRALTKTGALVHIDLEPSDNHVGHGRIFFHKIKKYIKKKLVMAALAIILVVKLIALKLIFVLPIILGVTTAKKIFLKILLFLFPALSHIFKLCSWYHQNYHTTKPVGPPNPYYRNKKVGVRDPVQLEKESLIRAASLAAKAPPSPVRDELLRVSAAKLSESNRVKAETELVRQQQEILAAQDPDSIAAEKFYGTLLERVDIILGSIGAKDIGCKERAVCSLYKDPFKHAPYSNLVSNELSKDSNELVPPADSTMALRYFRYVQAARDGQESKDCVLLYPNCNVDYNK
ncbi:jg22302 [Pararge aegeria aegeria]|uniref:Jg22302 protein n=1 Tax=Pararge aegeria aegeria TaxID=348720 RepID=A0A8S4SPA4_9NEOP|nr:jg22302 [Pararge aegeria aegeria]